MNKASFVPNELCPRLPLLKIPNGYKNENNSYENLILTHQKARKKCFRERNNYQVEAYTIYKRACVYIYYCMYTVYVYITHIL